MGAGKDIAGAAAKKAAAGAGKVAAGAGKKAIKAIKASRVKNVSIPGRYGDPNCDPRKLAGFCVGQYRAARKAKTQDAFLNSFGKGNTARHFAEGKEMKARMKSSDFNTVQRDWKKAFQYGVDNGWITE